MSEIKTMPLWEVIQEVKNANNIESVYLYDQVSLELIDIVDIETAEDTYAYKIVRKYEATGNNLKAWLI